jgi:hypothetical protein
MKRRRVVTKSAFATKVAAGAQLQKMTGWNEPERVELTGDSLNAYIIALRRQPIGGGEVLELENGEPELENNENGFEHRPGANE